VHPFIIKLKYAFENESNIYMVLEIMEGGELYNHIKLNGRLSLERSRF